MKRWALSGLLGILGLANLFRAGMSFRMTIMFTKLNLAMLPFLGGLYAILGIGLLALSIICWRRNRQCPAFFSVLGYEITIWIVRLAAYQSSYARSLWLRNAIFSLSFLVIIFILTHKPHNRVGKKISF
jgi:hypothetical protein